MFLGLFRKFIFCDNTFDIPQEPIHFHLPTMYFIKVLPTETFRSSSKYPTSSRRCISLATRPMQPTSQLLASHTYIGQACLNGIVFSRSLAFANCIALYLKASSKLSCARLQRRIFVTILDQLRKNAVKQAQEFILAVKRYLAFERGTLSLTADYLDRSGGHKDADARVVFRNIKYEER